MYCSPKAVSQTMSCTRTRRKLPKQPVPHKSSKVLVTGYCVQVKDKEIAKLEARATSAEGLLAEAKQKGEVEKGGALSSALAAARKASDERESELRKAMREGEAKLKDRVERLETDNASLRRCSSEFLTFCSMMSLR